MISKITPNHPLRALFSGLVEQVFMTELGICDTRLTDYISTLLGDFVHVDEIYQLHDVDGETIRDVSKAEAEAYLGPDVAGKIRGLLINRYIGRLHALLDRRLSGVSSEANRRSRSTDRVPPARASFVRNRQ